MEGSRLSPWQWIAASTGLLLALGNAAFAAEREATALFDGKNLDAWVAMHGGEWSVEDSVIVGRNGTGWSTDPEKSGSWLRSRKEYADFVWEFEYAINERGNSGVFLRSGLPKNPAFTGHEMQILDDRGRNPAVWSTGALYDVVAAKVNPSKPAGEWNAVRIETTGPRIQIQHNGHDIVDHVSDRQTRGFIGLQNHDERAVVRFRNLRLTEKSPPTPFSGAPHRLPGTIEAEHFDKGAAGIAYRDVDEANQGAPYRETTQVDIEARPDASNGHGIGWTRAGEWLVYSVDVADPGTYDLEIPVASHKPGGSFHIEADGVDVTGPITIPDTGGWNILRTIRHPGIVLKQGPQTLTVVMDSEGPSGSIGDIDLFRFSGPRPAE
ncbi:MAG: family 16 glycoside hydrolase [Verrucomicrobiales bacterium]